MPDFLTRRNGTWHFARRVPIEFAELDHRGVVKHSTRIKIANDRAGRRAARVAEKFNAELEQFWKGLSGGKPMVELSNYEAARARARALGFEYIENEQLVWQGPEARLERLEALFSKGVANDRDARVAVLGTEKRPHEARPAAPEFGRPTQQRPISTRVDPSIVEARLRLHPPPRGVTAAHPGDT